MGQSKNNNFKNYLQQDLVGLTEDEITKINES